MYQDDAGLLRVFENDVGVGRGKLAEDTLCSSVTPRSYAVGAAADCRHWCYLRG